MLYLLHKVQVLQGQPLYECKINCKVFAPHNTKESYSLIHNLRYFMLFKQFILRFFQLMPQELAFFHLTFWMSTLHF